MRNIQLKSWGKKFFETYRTENVPISLIQYREDYCEIYELPNNKIIKLSSNDEGYTTAMQLCGKKNKNIVDFIVALLLQILRYRQACTLRGMA